MVISALQFSLKDDFKATEIEVTILFNFCRHLSHFSTIML